MNELFNDLDEINEHIVFNKLIGIYNDLEELYNDRQLVINAIEINGITPELFLFVGEGLRGVAPEFYEGNVDVSIEKLSTSLASVGQAMQNIFMRLLRIIIDMILRNDKINKKMLKSITSKHNKVKSTKNPLMWKDDNVTIVRPVRKAIDLLIDDTNEAASEIIKLINDINDQDDADAFEGNVIQLLKRWHGVLDHLVDKDTAQAEIASLMQRETMDLFNISAANFVMNMSSELPDMIDVTRKAVALKNKVRYGGKTNWSVTYKTDVTPVYVISILFEIATAINASINTELIAMDKLTDNIQYEK